jgi:hypothetical protein
VTGAVLEDCTNGCANGACSPIPSVDAGAGGAGGGPAVDAGAGGTSPTDVDSGLGAAAGAPSEAGVPLDAGNDGG